ncbi:hypothetical protein OTERR_17240 [Oryzomicrobium terrae]|uniref:Methanethiol S-methyltransferase n=1 Tax=Oryzomicrobium terrae TaxID=1735038 RepID=A0A5C1E8K8_9RHOO|nr:hypothetical protein [Oryzomicrobium terrae]QEL65200.1 hypothetical protein OTERR_17240 [Oryzomicrobium terrae]
MPDLVFRLALLALAWLGYFALHSLLASLPIKHAVARRWPAAMPAYRLGFNLLAVLFLLAPLGLLYGSDWPSLWRWQGYAAWLANGLALAALAGFIWSLRYYDGEEFIGLRQWRGHVRQAEDQEHFQLSPLHRWVRHPWYALALVLIWTRPMDAGMLLTALLATLYFVVGSRLEERKLLIYHGDIYRRYRQRVPGLVPLPWKHLSRDEVAALLATPPRT